MSLCLVVTVLVSASSLSLGGLFAGFVFGMTWSVRFLDGGFLSLVVGVIVLFDVLWDDSFLGWLWLDMSSCYLR